MKLVEEHAYEVMGHKGYGRCRLRYRFGDDDRVIFFGNAQAGRLADRFLKPKHRAVIRSLIRKGLRIRVEAPQGLDEPCPSLCVIADRPESISSNERAVVALLLSAATDDVQVIARALEVEGRALIDAGDVPMAERQLMTFRTPTLTFSVERVPGDTPFGVLGDYDMDTRESMISGNLKYADIVCRGVDCSGRVVVEKRFREVLERTPRSLAPESAREVLHKALDATRPEVSGVA